MPNNLDSYVDALIYYWIRVSVYHEARQLHGLWNELFCWHSFSARLDMSMFGGVAGDGGVHTTAHWTERSAGRGGAV